MSNDDPTRSGRYLADQMTLAERAEYESTLQQDPQVLGDLEATARFKVGLGRLRELGELERLINKSTHPRPTALWALAAALTAVVIGVVLWRPTLPPSDRTAWLTGSQSALLDRSGQPLLVRTTVAVFRKRSGSLDAVAALPTSPGSLELRVLPMTPVPTARYRLEMFRARTDGSKESLGSVDQLSPAPDGFVSVYADASHLLPGRYTLTLDEQVPSGAANAAAQAFQLELTSQSNK